MHKSYNHTLPHMVSLLFVADIDVNLLYWMRLQLLAVFGWDYYYFWNAKEGCDD